VAFYAAGSIVHFTIAFVLLWLVAFGIGVDPGFSASATPATVTVLPCVPARAAAGCAAGDPSTPAVRAGLRAGDTIIAVAGRPVSDWAQLSRAIVTEPAGTPEPFTILRHGRQLTVQVTLAYLPHKGPFLGIEPAAPAQGFRHPGLIGAISYAGSEFGSITAGSVHALAEIPRAIPYLFSPNRAGTPGGQVSSVVGAAGVTGQVADAEIGWGQKITDLAGIVVSLNIFVGLFNVLPLLPMDGGKIAVVLYERARAVLARLRHKPEPGLTDIRWLIPVSLGMFALLVAFSLLLITADIVNPVRLVG
jgi:membrane-associated protease RseP (regulator of RpoE activity)